MHFSGLTGSSVWVNKMVEYTDDVGQTCRQLMSLGTSAIQGWWGPSAKTRHSKEVPWQSCEQEPALKVATNQHCHTEGTSVEKLT